VLALRAQHPSWGGRKLRRRLLDQGAKAVPAASTIGTILARHGQIDAADAAKHRSFQRFEHERPNALWQMDFKGHFALATGRCHPLTILDDHSRYNLCLSACANEATATVRRQLIATFRCYGLPERFNVDNGSPWGDGAGGRFTLLTVWLLRLGLRIGHSRPHHPQTNGKDERFHRTLKRDVLHSQSHADLVACQRAFDAFRAIYNHERPHEALDLAVPASRYRISAHAYPETLPPIEYDPLDQVRHVQQGGQVSFQGHALHVPKAFAGQPVAFRPTTTDGLWQVVFVAQCIAQVDLRNPSPQAQPVTHVPEHV
jgi:transposase InsO family protein